MEDAGNSLLALKKAKDALSTALGELERAGKFEISRAYYKTLKKLSGHIKVLQLDIEKEGTDNAN